MSLPQFHYMSPKTLDDLYAMLSRYGKKGKVIAGGTDVMPRMKDRAFAPLPEYLIDLKKVRGLNYIHYDPDKGLRIGATTTLKIIENSDVIRERFPVIAEAAHSIGSVQIRNRGTIAGNLCNAAPSADMAPSLIALKAAVKIMSAAGERRISLQDFFTGPGQTVLGDDEVVTEIEVPNVEPGTGVVYYKHSLRRAMDLAIVGVAAKVTVDRGNGGACRDVAIVLGAVAPTPVRATGAENVLVGHKITDDLLLKASREAGNECRPISDVRSSADYRREMVKVFTRRAVKHAAEMAHAVI